MKISLSAPAGSVNGPETVTATASIDVGPTPYYIQIFNENGTLIQECGDFTVCSVTFFPSTSGSDLVAFIGNSPGYPPVSSNIQAGSNTVHTVQYFIT